MRVSQNGSVSGPTEAEIARLVVEAARRAEAMGIVEPGIARLEAESIRQLAGKVRGAGIAMSAADVLHNVAHPSPEDVAALLEMIVAALEASPVPRFEWKGVARVFPLEDLAALLDVSVSSLKRYQAGDRDTPDEVAARLHFLALVLGDLAGSYNDIGIRRWFQRKRSQLDGRSPAAMLGGSWDPEDAGPQRVRQLARNLVALSGT